MLMQDCVPYLPTINGRHQKTVMHGDQGFFERGNYLTINSRKSQVQKNPNLARVVGLGSFAICTLSKVSLLFSLESFPYQTFMTGHNVSFSRSGEESLVERLDGIISLPQEWHKKKVRLTSRHGIPLSYSPSHRRIS